MLGQKVFEAQCIFAEPIDDGNPVEGNPIPFQLFNLPDDEFIVFKGVLIADHLGSSTLFFGADWLLGCKLALGDQSIAQFRQPPPATALIGGESENFTHWESIFKMLNPEK